MKNKFSISAKAKNLLLSLADSIAETLNFTSCYVCGGPTWEYHIYMYVYMCIYMYIYIFSEYESFLQFQVKFMLLKFIHHANSTSWIHCYNFQNYYAKFLDVKKIIIYFSISKFFWKYPNFCHLRMKVYILRKWWFKNIENFTSCDCNHFLY
jgi:hypothetical protein